MLVRCNACGKDLQSDGNKIISCGCSNMTSVHDDVVSANDMDQVIILQNNTKFKKESLFTSQELEYQEARRRRGVRKMVFEER